MSRILDIIAAGWGRLYLVPAIDEDQYQMILMVNPLEEEWPNGWVVAPLPSGAILYRQNQFGLYDIIKYDPENQNGYRKLGLVNTNYGEVNVVGGWPADPEAVKVVSDLDVIKVLVNNTIRYIDADEAAEMAELLGAQLSDNKVEVLDER